MTNRFLFDSSSLIVLVEIGYLQLFCDLIPNFTITSAVLKEVTLKPSPIKKAVEELISNGKIQVQSITITSHSSHQLYHTLGLHDGEISILLAAKKKKDVIVFDDLVARSVARAEGFNLTGLLGLLVSLKHTGKLSRNEVLVILSAINKTNFRMTALLYETILKELESKK
ncbi:MAG: hypothetical protein HZR80_18480 [Candidatus Heimdallarchaeota archaeon]